MYYYKLGFENTNEYDSNFETLATSISKLNNYDLYFQANQGDLSFIVENGILLREYKTGTQLGAISDSNPIVGLIIEGGTGPVLQSVNVTAPSSAFANSPNYTPPSE